MKRTSVLLSLLLCIVFDTWGQLNAVFVQKDKYAFTKEDIQNLSILNTSASTIRESLEIELQFQGNLLIGKFLFSNIELNPGLNSIDVSSSNATYAENYLGSLLSSGGKIQNDILSLCVKIKEPNSDFVKFEKCFTILLIPPIPVKLLKPNDDSKIVENRPFLRWIPPVPITSDTKYWLTLCELKENQTYQDAIANNVPLINLKEIETNFLMYPIESQSLEVNKSYVWRVIAYENSSEGSRSDVWKFFIDTIKTKQINNQYIIIPAKDNHNYYEVKDYLNISLDNPYSKSSLNYSIESTSSKKNQIGELPKIMIEYGQNYFRIPIDKISGIKNNQVYLFKTTIGGKTSYVSFKKIK